MTVLLQPTLTEGVTPNYTTLVTTFGGQKGLFIWRSVCDSTLARKINKLLFSPSDRYMIHIVDRHLLSNIPIIRKDLAASNKIIEPGLNALKGKTVSHKILRYNCKL